MWEKYTKNLKHAKLALSVAIVLLALFVLFIIISNLKYIVIGSVIILVVVYLLRVFGIVKKDE